ncbi:MAG: hypothetical protein AB1633_08535 [Elusimicrobiota bacterium]
MKKIILAVLVGSFTAGVIYAGGLHFGMTSAVKSKVEELDKKVKEKKAATTTTVTPTAQSISGTVAKGKPIISATVTIKDSSGTSKSATTGATGKYTADVTGLNFPLLLKVTEGTATFFSIANASGTCNIHPFTDMVVRTYFKSSKGISDMKDAYENNFASLGTLPQPETINTIKAVVTTLVSSILERQGIDPLKYDMFTSTFEANSSGFDKAIEETQITAGTDYSYVVVKDTTTNTVISTMTPTANDTTAPAVPTNPAATAVSGTSIKLTWTAPSGTDVAGYVIYRGGVKIAAVSYTTYIDVGLTSGTQYSYEVEAFDWAGNKSAKTTVVTATTVSEFAIAAGGSVIRGAGWIAYDGTNYLVEYSIKDSTAESATNDLYAQFVSASGSTGTLISLDVMASGTGDIAFGNGTYFTTWTSTETSAWDVSYLRGMFISPSGAKSPVYSIASNVSQNDPRTPVACDGKNFLVVWTTGYGDSRDIYGQLVSTSGLVGSAIPICTATWNQRGPRIVYGNNKYFVVWVDGRRHVNVSTDSANPHYYETDIYARFISTDGGLGSEIEVDVNNYESDGTDPFVAYDWVNKKFLVAYLDLASDAASVSARDWNIYGKTVDSNGNVSSRFVISDKPGPQHLGIPIFDGSKYFITWVDGLGSLNVKSQAAFFDTNGNRLGNEITLVVPKSSTENFDVALPIFTGTNYFLAIVRANISGTPGGHFYITTADIYGMFFNP